MRKFLQFLIVPLLLVGSLAFAQDGGSLPLSVFYQWGLKGDIPLTGDFDGDQVPDLVVWRPTDGVWYIRRSGNGYSASNASTYQWGLPGDLPLIADMDADGRADFVVWRPSTGTFYTSFNRLYPVVEPPVVLPPPVTPPPPPPPTCLSCHTKGSQHAARLLAVAP